MISDFMLAVTSALLIGTVSALFLYYRRIITLRQEYYRSKTVVDDIVLSVDRQFRRQKDRVLFVAQKIENVLRQNKIIVERVEEYGGRLNELSQTVSDVPQIEKKFSGQIQEMLNEVEDLKAAQIKVMTKLVEIEKIKREAATSIPDVKIEAAIPIKREKVLEPLTETELLVLETIGKEGEKTAPEIKEKIGLTREHTARLMKKLYKDGYLERDTHKMPYIYRLKEEMEKILKKRETNSS